MEAARPSWTLKASWILLMLLGILIALGGVASLTVAYRGEERLGEVEMDRLEAIDPALPGIVRGRRATSAALAFSLGSLTAWIALTAYRRREKWAWQAMLFALGIGSVLSLLRIPLLNTTLGAVTATVALVWLLVALSLAYRDFK